MKFTLVLKGHEARMLALLLISLIFTGAQARGDSRVILTRAGARVETTIPGNFASLDAILPALFSLADQAADKGAEQAYIGGRKDRKDLIYYYRGVRVEGDVVIVSFAKEAMPYFSGSPSYDTAIMTPLVGTVMLYQPDAKQVKLEIDGKFWKNEDG
ncbi:hypothetical protein OKA05_03695 [Luteolibacter arcticus]|uniref:Uncharacterized protein n=1 Tax=Luteolibacter arcticus TaxID=1581411 RepID=A0ABT3GDF2_9BACT|nr:hypothetical protein [Luteolibacter arcticus]MCW1921641.1 hypothetical protein [Luteolibacter arcticus]